MGSPVFELNIWKGLMGKLPRTMAWLLVVAITFLSVVPPAAAR